MRLPIQPHGAATVTVEFTPPDPGSSFSANIRVHSDATAGARSAKVKLTGSAKKHRAADPDGDRYANAHSDRIADLDSYRDGNCDSHDDRDRNSHCYRNCQLQQLRRPQPQPRLDGDGDSNRDSNRDRDSDFYCNRNYDSVRNLDCALRLQPQRQQQRH